MNRLVVPDGQDSHGNEEQSIQLCSMPDSLRLQVRWGPCAQ